jgi:hypothetical protein
VPRQHALGQQVSQTGADRHGDHRVAQQRDGAEREVEGVGEHAQGDQRQGHQYRGDGAAAEASAGPLRPAAE